MSLTELIEQWLAGLRAILFTWQTPRGGRSARTLRFPLTWRAPWQAWQLLSLTAGTLVSPPFCVIGILLLINAHSDRRWFWPSVLVLIALTNAITIVAVNQRHHRRPFIRYRQVILHYLKVCLLVGSGLFLLLAWSMGILHDFIATVGASDPGSELLWNCALNACFVIPAFLPASVIHAQLAFENPYAY
ncbi:hypothetical protein [Paraburkholderia sp. ZP32-5]|uniref:hypothetical protein n=1 Tax=Paraburkholderia sp. ZP32-5 TaxID=2883245 RepID=UPI001F24D612|nr:hypothetical protein [Paraburkholderia sp. ZP32-5]